MACKAQNWVECEANSRSRGSLTLRFEEGVWDDWQTFGARGQARLTEAAVRTSLMLRNVFKLALRQAEGFLGSVIKLMGMTILAPDHTAVSRCAVRLPALPSRARDLPTRQSPLHVLIDSAVLQVYGAGQWLEAKHGTRSCRKWRKLHLLVDAESAMVVAHPLTDQRADDLSQVAPLLD